jgi:hypothetical protein
MEDGMNEKMNIKKIFSGLLIFAIIVSVVNFLLYQELFFKEVIHWINRYPEPIISRLGVSIFITSIFWLLFITSPIKVNIGFINVDNSDLRNLLKPFLPTSLLIVFAVLSSVAFFLSPPECNSPLLSVKLNGTQELRFADTVSLSYAHSSIRPLA